MNYNIFQEIHNLNTHIRVDEHNNYYFSIRKCGSRTLTTSTRLYCNNLKEIDNITIYVREPYGRFLSGVDTLNSIYTGNITDLTVFKEHLMNVYNKCLFLDEHNLIEYLDKHLFIESHTFLQFHWIFQLILQLKHDTLLTFKDLSDMNKITNAHIGVHNNKYQFNDRFKNNAQLKYYMQYDDMIMKYCVNKTVSIQYLFDILKRHYFEFYKNELSPVEHFFKHL